MNDLRKHMTYRTHREGTRTTTIELTNQEFSTLRGYLRRAQRKGVSVDTTSTMAALLAMIGALEEGR